MNAIIAKPLSLAVVVVLWTTFSHLAKLPLQLWPVIVGLACFLAAGGGISGLTKSLTGTISGVVWAMLYVGISGALGRQAIVDALVLGAATFGMVLQGRVPLLGHTASVVAGAAASMGVMGVRSVSMQGSVRVMVALLIGTGLGFGAEFLASKIKTRNS